MNQDGFDDIIAINVGEKNFIYFGDESYQFKSFLPFGRSVDKTMALAVGDLNQDGKLDIVVGNNNQSNQYYINNGSALTMFDYGLRTTITYGITLGDVDNDGDLDIIEANSGSENLIYYNNGALRK